jgi:gliding motility-associated-like protein
MKKINRIVSIITIVILFLGFLNTKILAQCNITANASPSSICAGESVTLTSSGDCSYLMNNDFNDGTIGSGWSSDAGPMFNNPCNPSCDGSIYLWIGPATNFPRQVTTISYNLVCSPSKICFDMKYAEQGKSSPCEGPDLTAEGVHLQYSTNGGSSWTDINYWDPVGGHSPQYLNWNHYCENLPPAAQTTNTKIRWWQSNTSGNGYDHWGLDNVEITFVPPPPESVTWSHGPLVFNPPPVYPTVTTIYTVTVSNGCAEAHEDVVVTVNPAPIVDAGQDQIVCGGGSVVIGGSPTGSGAGPTYSYSWSPAAGLSSTTAANPTANPSTITTYTVTVTSNGCSSTDNVVVAIYPNPSVDAGPDHSMCGGEMWVIGGSPTASGGLSPYSYAWSPATALSSTIIANPTANPTVTTTYTVTVTDDNGCVVTDDVLITINSTPVADAGQDKSICNGFNTVIGGSPTGSGAGPVYTYSWSPATGLNSTTIANPTANPTTTTVYTVTVTSNGCPSTDNVTVTVNPIPVADAGQDKSICNGSNTVIGGSPTGSGAGPAYTYSWSPATGLSSTTTANPTANPTNTTEYTVIVTSNGCSAVDNVIVTVYPNPSADAGSDNDICSGANIVIGGSPTASGGTFPYFYAWSPAASLNLSDIANPTANPTNTTEYTVTVTDDNGCSATDNISITVNSNPVADAGQDQSVCGGGDMITGGNPTANGGLGPYSYAWSPTTGLNDPNIANPIVNIMSVITYTVTVTDANGCTSTDDVVISVYPIPVADAGSDKTVCEGDNVIIGGSPTASGGLLPYTYLWGPSTGLNSVIVPNPMAGPSVATTYIVTITDNNGCAATDTMVVTVNPSPNINFTADPFNGCEPLLVNFIDNTTPAIQIWSWNFGDPSSGNTSTEQNPSHLFGNAGVYNITLTATTTDGCTSSYTYENMITVYPQPVADFYAKPGVVLVQNPTISFIDQSTGASYWDWTFGDPESGAGNTSADENPSHTYSGEGIYNVLLTVANYNNTCFDTTMKQVQVVDIVIPNVFTPNSDGKNDYFHIVNIEKVTDSHLMIFNRWGNLIFEKDGYQNDWDGRNAPDGVYYFILNFHILKNDEMTGTVTIMR